MKSDVEVPCATMAILQDARTMQAAHGGRMIRDVEKAVSRAVSRLWHARHAAAGQHSAAS